MKEIFQYLKPYRKGFALATVFVAVSTVCDLLLPTVMSEILNNGVSQMDFDYIVKCCLVMLGVSGLGLITVLLGSWISSGVIAGFCADIRGAVFRKVNEMSFEEFGELGVSALVTRATHDVMTVSWVAAGLCGTFVTVSVLFFGGFFLAAGKDFLLSLILLGFIPVIFAVVVLCGKKIVPLWEQSDAYIDKQNGIMRERIRGIRVIRAFNAEEKEHGRIEKATKTMAEYIIKANVSMGLIAPMATFLLNTAMVLIVYFGGLEMETGGRLTGGDIFAIVQYISLISSGVIMGAYTIISFPQARVAADRVAQVLNCKGMSDSVAPQELVLTGDIRLENVTFRYAGATECALQDVSMHIRPGEKAAIIGGTGSGKSTIVSMLLGFRMPTEGKVYLDGIFTEKLSRYTMRENMSCVLQNTTIYTGTIRENIRMGKQSATDTEIMAAAEVAQAAEFIAGFPEGLDHPIKQSGKNLSGGQKQRLSIARAVLKDAPIFIFDDCFSALDFMTEAKLRNALGKRIGGRTQIVITQRVTSAMYADIVFVMDKGRLVDAGTHEELLCRCSVYQEIYASQTGGVSGEEAK